MSIQNPPNASNVEKVVQVRIDALTSLKDAKETLTVEWRGSQIHIPVITMPLDLLTYNPGTHRIRAQRSSDPAREHHLNTAPWGGAAQNYLHNLLMGDPANPSNTDPSFISLLEDLKAHGQNDPGIITRAGVLINGNTRRAALMELGAPNIRVGVLPSDAGHEDLQSVELSLQLRKDHRRDYSFMNFLLAIDERVIAGHGAAKIQKDFRIKATVYDRSRWILDFVRDAIERSKVCLHTGTAVGLSLVEFETHQGKLEELYRAFVSLAPKSSSEASALREQRLLALALNKSKTDLRLIGADFTKRYMKEQLPDVVATAPLTIPGTQIVVNGPDPEVVALQQLTNDVLRAKSIAAASVASKEELAGANSVLGKFDDSLSKGLYFAGKQARVIKRKFATADRLSDACDSIDYAIEAVATARATSNFDPEDLDESLLALKSKLEKLAVIVTRGSDSSSDGVLWLQSMISASGTKA